MEAESWPNGEENAFVSSIQREMFFSDILHVMLDNDVAHIVLFVQFDLKTLCTVANSWGIDIDDRALAAFLNLNIFTDTDDDENRVTNAREREVCMCMGENCDNALISSDLKKNNVCIITASEVVDIGFIIN